MMGREMVKRGGCRGGAAADAAGRYVVSAIFFGFQTARGDFYWRGVWSITVWWWSRGRRRQAETERRKKKRRLCC